MSVTINTNLDSLRIQNTLSGATSKLSTAMQRMSNGLKINSAKDDAAGTVISARMQVQLDGNKICQNNVQNANALLSTAEGNIDVVLSNLSRIRDLTLEAKNGTYSKEEISAMQAEVDQRMAEIDRVSDSSKYSQLKLFGGDELANGATFQVGTNSSEDNTITITNDDNIFSSVKFNDLLTTKTVDETKLLTQLQATQTGIAGGLKFSDQTFSSIKEFNEAQENAEVKTNTVYQVGDKYYYATALDGSGNVECSKEGHKAIDVTGTGMATTGKAVGDILYANGSTTESTQGKYFVVTKVGDAAAGNLAECDEYGNIIVDDISKLAKEEGALVSNAKLRYYDKATDSYYNVKSAATFGGEPKALTAAAVLTELADKYGTTISTQKELDARAAGGTATEGEIRFNSDTQTYQAYDPEAYGTYSTGKKAYVDMDVLNSKNVYSEENPFDLATMNQDDFVKAIDALDSAIDDLTSRKSAIGSFSNRLESALNTLSTQYENLSSAKSIITDADIASEASGYTQQNILQQVSTSLLAQANQSPSIALSLV